MNKRKNEQGAATLMEAVFVFPIMFFVILFLIYMGNMFYMRSRVDTIVTEYAVLAASQSVDPFLKEISSSGSVPTTISDVKPYHSIFGSHETDTVREKMVETLNRQGTGFFAGMGLRDISINKFKKESTLVTNTFTADVTYSIRFPIKFIFSDSPTVLQINSLSVVSLTDTPEFILDVDMVIDFLETKGVDKKLADIKEKVSQFIH